MATVVNRPKGHKWIQFKCPKRGTRPTIRRGKVDDKQAFEFMQRVESLVQTGCLAKRGVLSARFHQVRPKKYA